MDRRREWSIRITHEAQLYDANVFATMTYADDHLPASRSLEYRDVQLFMKRLRKEMKGVSPGPRGTYPVRFFVAGEYGGRTKRPHWHAILFNVWFKDQKQLLNETWTSSSAESLWQKGSVVLGSVTPASAAYVAGYANKKKYGAAARAHYEDVVNLSTGELTSRRPEFVEMSTRPGIGSWWFEKFGRDLFPLDSAVMAGKQNKVPRFYWERFKRSADPGEVEELAYKRYLRAMDSREDSTPERRAVREEVALARAEMFEERGL